MTKQDMVNKLREIAGEATDANDFARRGCEAGVFVSRAEGRRCWEMVGKHEAMRIRRRKKDESTT